MNYIFFLSKIANLNSYYFAVTSKSWLSLDKDSTFTLIDELRIIMD